MSDEFLKLVNSNDELNQAFIFVFQNKFRFNSYSAIFLFLWLYTGTIKNNNFIINENISKIFLKFECNSIKKNYLNKKIRDVFTDIRYVWNKKLQNNYFFYFGKITNGNSKLKNNKNLFLSFSRIEKH